MRDFLLNFYQKDLKQNCEHSAKIANKPSKKNANKQDYEQMGASEPFLRFPDIQQNGMFWAQKNIILGSFALRFQ